MKSEEKMRERAEHSKFKFLFMVLCVSVALSSQAFASTMYQITIKNLSPNVLSPAAFITHDAGFDLFDLGVAASSAVELLAETGNPADVISLAASSGSVFDYQVASGGILAQGFTGKVVINADLAHPWLSFMSMMGISNDGFIGGTTGDGAISLFSGGLPLYGTYVIEPADVWDAGTEVNDEAYGSVGALGGGNGGTDENGVITLNHPGILGIGGVDGIPVDRDWTGGSVAQITIAPIPEPSTVLLLGFGLAGLAGIGRKTKSKE
jgi:hypothetical protein